MLQGALVGLGVELAALVRIGLHVCVRMYVSVSTFSIQN